MEIILKELTLENFKGVRNLSLSPGRKVNMNIQGMNGTGKTTCMDAFLWLLFDKDSQGKSDFAVKTLDENNNEIHNLNHSVDLTLSIDGVNTTLKKTFKEKWTKKRGTGSQEFTGHTTDYEIDGVPTQKKKWDDYISNIISEETLKLLTDPMYFNNLHWAKRREILLEVCGNITDQDVIDSDKSLSGLSELLKGRDIEDHKKVIAAQKKKINDRLQEIPARIDELNKSVADISKYNVPKIEKKIKDLEEKIQIAKDDKSASILRGQRVEVQTQIRELENKIEDMKRDARKNATKELDEIQKQLKLANNDLHSIVRMIENTGTIMHSNERKMEDLRKSFKSRQSDIYKKPLPPSSDNSSCPKCGYILAEEENNRRLEEFEKLVTKEEELFKSKQAKDLQEINQAGKKLKEENFNHNADIMKMEIERDQIESQIKTLEAKEKEAEDRVLLMQKLDITGKEELNQIDVLNAELVEIDKKIEGAVPPDTSEMEAQKRAEEVKLAEIESNKKTMARIEELMKEEKKLAAEYENLEGQTAMIEKFTVQKVSLMDEKINSKFQLARFKMFKEQINGGIADCCETLFNGVPYSSGLNTGAQINVGLDIIRTLSEHYGVEAPIFIDHAESVNEILPAGSQMFYLRVSNDKELTVTYK